MTRRRVCLACMAVEHSYCNFIVPHATRKSFDKRCPACINITPCRNWTYGTQPVQHSGSSEILKVPMIASAPQTKWQIKLAEGSHLTYQHWSHDPLHATQMKGFTQGVVPGINAFPSCNLCLRFMYRSGSKLPLHSIPEGPLYSCMIRFSRTYPF